MKWEVWFSISIMKPDPRVLEYGKAALAELNQELDSLQAKWAEANTKRSAWLVILGEDGGSGAEPATREENSTPPVPSDSENDITDVARQIINETGEAGFKPRDITKRLVAKGKNVGGGFASNLLFRMKKKGEVVEHNGRYYIPKFDPKPRLHMSVGVVA